MTSDKDIVFDKMANKPIWIKADYGIVTGSCFLCIYDNRHGDRMCQYIPARYVEDYTADDAVYDDDAPSDMAYTASFDSRLWDLIYPIEVLSWEEMFDILQANDEIYKSVVAWEDLEDNEDDYN